MDTATKKELISAYKEKKTIGCIYLLKNTENGKALLLTAPDMQGAQNRYNFAIKTGGCVHPKLQADWKNGCTFDMEILDTLEKKDDTNNKEFAEDLKALAELWQQKLIDQKWY